MPTPVLSVCIPTYNRAEYLRQCLDAFLPQAIRHNVALCVSDNGSSDNTRDILDAFAKRYPLFTFRSNPLNQGIDKNIVDVVNLATTRFAWLFGDDDLP